ncbi:DUF982 domain-containing protein [Agrobacterium tumefaciens]|uniref:DUF982 domain-containing protein n=1 Tax=Agrobacterium tumefaciens TaxID=358 RepID=UPI00287C20CD|nr:DUF982 domain-containing protein [Agrobacterium tumefaciens]MDS7596073.1 DUF982 domain-containing protein [Agrobacterium tumefaciens]
MKNERWMEPVEVNLEACGKNSVAGPLEALALLTDRWPTMRGLSFVKARSACRAALDGRKSPEEARRCFTDAVSEVQKNTH